MPLYHRRTDTPSIPHFHSASDSLEYRYYIPE